MDGQGFDRFAKLLASGVSRRHMVRAFAASAGGTALAAVGLGPGGVDVLAASNLKLKLRAAPRARFEDGDAIISFQTTQAAACVIEYGPTKELGLQVASESTGRTHKVTVPDLAPKTRYFYRVQMQSETDSATSKVYTLQTPGCRKNAVLCGSVCVPTCADGMALDEATCACVCQPGLADCDGDPANGCETRLDTVENCLACGNSCDDGNACTDNACDPASGCVTTNVEDGTACAGNGTCQGGACIACETGGTCERDRDCCDDEVCCGGACVAKTAFEEDVNNCGSCGQVCAQLPCQVATCVEGACQASPAEDGAACGDDNPCTTDDHCMAGSCMGNPVENGTPCDGGVCTDGMCAACAPGQACTADSDCCDGEACCAGACVALTSFASDPANCGACGTVCEHEAPCQQATCADGVCGTAAAAEGESCDDGNPCTKKDVCAEGVCAGTPVDDGTACGANGTCQQGSCVEPDVFAATAVGVIFGDDFESGNLNRWSRLRGIVAQTTHVAAGTYAARATSTGNGAYARRLLETAQPDIYARTQFKIVSQGANSVYVLRVLTLADSPVLSVQVTSGGKLEVYNHVARTQLTSTTLVSKGVWHDLQIHTLVAGSSGAIEVWFDGTRISTLSKTANLGTTGIGSLQIGDNAASTSFDLVFDDSAICVGTCPSTVVTAPAPETDPSTAPGAASGVLLASYRFNVSGSFAWAKTAYRPRQFKAGLVIADPLLGSQKIDNHGAYAGWDIFPTLNEGVLRRSTNVDSVELTLNRAATLGIVWRSAAQVPSWLASWSRGANVVVNGKDCWTYTKKVAAGRVTLGGVYNPSDSPSTSRDMYWVLLAETDGLRSPAPTVPGGRETPQPNQTCPAWVHDQHVASGPDGTAYATWHHQIDAVYWCYYRHEHGTNPAHFALSKPTYGYVAAKHGMTEPHAGFKTYVFDDSQGNRWMISHHFGTGGLARACNRFHTVDIAVKSKATNELLVDVHLMGDFGPSTTNNSGETLMLTPVSCPDQGTLAGTSKGNRAMPVQSESTSLGYEPWRVTFADTLFGFTGSFHINTLDPIVVCNTLSCDAAVAMGTSGTNRLIKFNDLKLTAGKNSGTFYTDPFGKTIVTSTATGAVRQYIKPGLTLAPGYTGNCFDVNAWGQLLICDVPQPQPSTREGSVQAPN